MKRSKAEIDFVVYKDAKGCLGAGDQDEPKFYMTIYTYIRTFLLYIFLLLAAHHLLL